MTLDPAGEYSTGPGSLSESSSRECRLGQGIPVPDPVRQTAAAAHPENRPPIPTHPATHRFLRPARAGAKGGALADQQYRTADLFQAAPEGFTLDQWVIAFHDQDLSAAAADRGDEVFNPVSRQPHEVDALFV